jgi:IS605 OrfB family transposase
MRKRNSDNIIIRSSKLSIKFSNKNKKDKIISLVEEYVRVVKKFIDIIWGEEKVKSLLPKEITNQINDSWLSARMIQCAGKQASGIVRGTKKKQEKRLWQINKFNELKQFKKARKLQAIYNKIKMDKPNVESLDCELDERFVKQDFKNDTSFDGWVTITSIGNKEKIQIPVKRTKHFNKMFEKGNKLKGIRLSKTKITFNFEIEKPIKIQEGKTLGIDIGKKTAISCSNGFTSQSDTHGHTLDSIINNMSKKKKGSNAFKRSQEHRKNYINWSINQLNLKDVKQINIEKIRNLRKGKRTNAKLSRWTYTDIFGKLKDKCELLGVQVNELNPTYTSQRCSSCGWVRKGNRQGKQFKCDRCGHTQDADLNASLNLSLNLPSIKKEERLKQKNRTGFYWLADCQQSIVADAQKQVMG